MAHGALEFAVNGLTLAALEALESAAITLIFVRGSIFARLRSAGPGWWRELSSCAMCSGFWIGAGVYSLNISYMLDPWEAWFWLAALKNGALAAMVAFLLVRVLDALEKAAE